MTYLRSVAVQLAELATLVPWERFRPRLEDARSGLSDGERRELPPYDDALVVFRAILVGAIFEWADDGLEFMLGDRMSIRKFVGLDDPADEPPAAHSLWLHREQWIQTGVMAEFAAEVDGRWRRAGHCIQGLRSLVGTAPARVGWIADAHRRFRGGQGPVHVFGVDGPVKVDVREAVARLTRVAGWMAARCHVLVYTGRSPDGTASDADDLLAPIRPAAPLVLDWDATEEEASTLAVRAVREGRQVVCHGTGDGSFEERPACGFFLAAVEKMFERPVEILVAGCAPAGSVAPVVAGLRSHGCRVALIRDAILTTGREPEERAGTAWAEEGTVVSLHDLRHPVHDSRQISFGDIEIAEAYMRLDELIDASSDFIPLVRLEEAVPWELLRPRLEVSRRNPRDAQRRRTPLDLCDAVVLFKSLLLGAIYDLSDEALAFLVHDRLTFRRFAGLGVTDRPPTPQQLRIHRKRWIKAGVMAELVTDIGARWERLGCRFQGIQRLMGVPVPGSDDGNADRVRPEPPGLEPEQMAPKEGAGKKRRSRRQRRKRRRKRR